VRYGNVAGSRGSVIPLFKQESQTGIITVTDKRMTRFWITVEQGVEFVIKCIEMMRGGEVFIPKLPSAKIMDLASAIAPGCKIKFTGIRPGEKINECLITEDEARHALEFKDFFVIKPELALKIKEKHGGKYLPEEFRYSSDKNDKWLAKEELRKIYRKL
jgi:FlaA1/EpsC-like NDP-sugar epimerase